MECAHPYRNDTNDVREIRIPGAASLTIRFDPATSTEAQCDFCQFFRDRLLTEPISPPFSGGYQGTLRHFPGLDGHPPLQVEGDRIFLHWVTDHSTVDWGWRLFVRPTFVTKRLRIPGNMVRLSLQPDTSAGDSPSDLWAEAEDAQTHGLWQLSLRVMPEMDGSATRARVWRPHFRSFVRSQRCWTPQLDARLLRFLLRRTRYLGLGEEQLLRVSWPELAARESLSAAEMSELEGIASELLSSVSASEDEQAAAAAGSELLGERQAESPLANDVWEWIWLRLATLEELNVKVHAMLPFVDWDSLTDMSSLASAVRGCRPVLLAATRMPVWRSALDCSATSLERRVQLVLSRSRAAAFRARGEPDTAARFTLYAQAFRRLHFVPPALLRRGGQVYQTIFKGERSTDIGGAARETFEEYCLELQSPSLRLLLPCANAGDPLATQGKEAWVPNPAATTPLDRAMFQFLGKLMGVAMRGHTLLNLRLPLLVWKRLLGQPVGLSDLDAMDTAAARNQIRFVRECSSAEEFNTMALTFTATNRNGAEVELEPGGRDRLVQWEDRDRYAAAVLEFKLHEFDEQINEIRHGLGTIVPLGMLALFSPSETERLVCGELRLDVETLKRHTEYRRCRPDDAFVRYFWEVLSEFSAEDQAAFLRFTWGRSRLPLSDGDWGGQHFTLYPSNRAPADLYLPVAETCFFTLEVPRYSSKEVMARRLLTAITLCREIDRDEGAASGAMEWET